METEPIPTDVGSEVGMVRIADPLMLPSWVSGVKGRTNVLTVDVARLTLVGAWSGTVKRTVIGRLS